MSKELTRLRKAHDTLEEEIKKKEQELINLKIQRGKIGRKIDRKKKEKRRVED